MKRVIFYLLAFAGTLIYLLYAVVTKRFPSDLQEHSIPITCAIIGGLGGCIYCLRGVYLNACVRDSWDKRWLPWYFIRPFVSVACGGVAYLFLQAGLLILQSDKEPTTSNIGFYALAFIAGLNVDKFIGKIEDLSQAAWGIEKSRASNDNAKDLLAKKEGKP